METNIVRLTCKEMRAQAREALSGKWTTAVLATLVYFLILSISGIANFMLDEGVAALFSIAFGFCVSGPLGLGYSYFVLKAARREDIEIGNIFEGFNHFVKVVILSILIGIFTILWTLLFIIPGIIAALRYSQAFFILLDNPDLSPMEAIRRSKQMMKGNKGKLFLLTLSFIGWALLCGITFGIGALWLNPYVYVALAVFYLALLDCQQTNDEDKKEII